MLQGSSSARAGPGERNVAMISMTLLLSLVDGIQNVMGIHLCSSHYPSAVYCQGNKQSGANISFYCSVQFASSVCQRKIMVHRTTVLTEILDLRAFNVLNNKCRITWEIGAKREK